MLGGAQFKATLLNQKALFSNIQCETTDSNSRQTRAVGKQLPAASDINRGLPLPAHSSAQRPLWAENAALQEVNQFHKAPELSVYARKLFFFIISQTQIHTLRVYCSATPTGFPSHHGGTQVMDSFRACQVPEVSKENQRASPKRLSHGFGGLGAPQVISSIRAVQDCC